jgi:hypothetical protein
MLALLIVAAVVLFVAFALEYGEDDWRDWP